MKILKFSPNQLVDVLLTQTEKRYIMCLCSNVSYDDARESINENPDAVKVVYGYREWSLSEYATSEGNFKYVIPVNDEGLEIESLEELGLKITAK